MNHRADVRELGRASKLKHATDTTGSKEGVAVIPSRFVVFIKKSSHIRRVHGEFPEKHNERAGIFTDISNNPTFVGTQLARSQKNSSRRTRQQEGVKIPAVDGGKQLSQSGVHPEGSLRKKKRA